MNRTDRLYAITEELRAAGGSARTAAWLAERFEVAPRTIKRDVSSLQQAGVPIWATAGPGGGYALDEAATLPPLTFSTAEAAAVAVALGAQRDLPFAPDGQRALTKVLGAMTPAQRAEVEALGGRVWVRHDEDATRTASARVIDEAMRREVVVVLDYVDAGGRSTERRPVEPMLFARTRGHWYLMAWCRRRRAGRWFRLDRVAGAHLTTERVTPRDIADVFGPVPEGAAPVNVR